MPTVCVVGSANVDLVFRTASLPRPGQTVPGSAFTVSPGGKGANQRGIPAPLGPPVPFVGCVGAAAPSPSLPEALRRHGVLLDSLRTVADTPTGTAGIVVDDAGQNCIVVVPGANALLTPDDIDRA